MNNKLLTVLLAIILAGTIGYIASQKMAGEEDRSPTDNTTQTAEPEPSGEGDSVDLSGKQLTAIPTDILNRTDITSLNLSNNQLTSLPTGISKLKNLQTLNVENNRLESLPTEIGQLTKLTSLDLGNNRLKSLPPELGELTNLKTLNLSGYQGPSSDIDSLKAKLSNTQIKT